MGEVIFVSSPMERLTEQETEVPANGHRGAGKQIHQTSSEVFQDGIQYQQLRGQLRHSQVPNSEKLVT